MSYLDAGRSVDPTRRTLDSALGVGRDDVYLDNSRALAARSVPNRIPASSSLGLADLTGIEAELSVLVVQLRDRCQVELQGELDLNTAWRFRRDLETVWGPVEFECSRLAFLDCSGLSVFIEQRNRGQAVSLLNASAIVRKLLQICCLTDLLEPLSVTSTPAHVRRRFR